MPKRDPNKFQIGDYWLRRDPINPGWYAYWYDREIKKQRRESLHRAIGLPVGATEAEAKVALAAYVTAKAPVKNAAPNEVSIAQIIFRYIKTAPGADTDFNGIASTHLSWWKDRPVSDLLYLNLCEFIKYLAAEKHHAPSTIHRYLAVLSAALNWARLNNQLLTVPKVLVSEAKIAAMTKVARRPKPRKLKIDELARFLDAIKSPHIWRFTILTLTTLGRPDAITDLQVFQFDGEGLVDLNPAGHVQNKKYRPTVPVAPTLAAWLPIWKRDKNPYLVHYKGKKIDNPKKGIIETAIAAGLVSEGDCHKPGRAVTPYTLRRTMGRLLRAEGVSLEDAAGMLGHGVQGLETTEIYADAAPDYLERVIEAVERILDRLYAHTKVAPIRPRDMLFAHNLPINYKQRRVYAGAQKDRNP